LLLVAQHSVVVVFTCQGATSLSEVLSFQMSLLLWRYSRPAWTRSCAACCRWPCFGRRVGL